MNKWLSAPFLGCFFLTYFLNLSCLQAQETASTSSNLTAWELLRSAEWVIIPLALLSIIVIALIVFNFFWLRKSHIASAEFLTQSDLLLKDRNLEGLLSLSEREKGACAQVLKKVILFAKENPTVTLDGLKEIAETAGNRATTRLSQPNTLLMDMGVMAPMVGLLGTVFGILKSFGTIASDATPMRTMLLAGGVSQALVATTIGLAIGLTAMLFYAFFRVRVQSMIGFFETNLTELIVKTSDCLSKPKNSKNQN